MLTAAWILVIFVVPLVPHQLTVLLALLRQYWVYQ
jgi:hypothetical protein